MSTISKTTITFVVLHRTDEPIVGFEGDGPLAGPLGEAMARSWDGNAVGAEVTQDTVDLDDGDVPYQLEQLGNDGTFFDGDLDKYVLKEDVIHRVWGIWDADQDTWYLEDGLETLYAAGVPMWRNKSDAQTVLDRLNED